MGLKKAEGGHTLYTRKTFAPPLKNWGATVKWRGLLHNIRLQSTLQPSVDDVLRAAMRLKMPGAKLVEIKEV